MGHMNFGVSFLDLIALPAPMNGVILRKICLPTNNSKGLLLLYA